MSESPKRPRQIPPYRLAAAELAKEIRAGAYDTDTPFPSEPALSERLGMARMTIRRALEVLRDEGLITTRWGAGSSVVPAAERPAPDAK
ncbi:GntR family transcriptional regulator [Kitasatospora sp. P5_F3]